MASHQLASVTITTQRCSLVYGETPCTAARRQGLECANTFKTCQDAPNYAPSAGTLVFTPAASSSDGINAIVDYRASATQIGVAGLGIGFDASITLQDFETLGDDLLADPYATTRDGVAGTYLGRLFSRYDNLIGRAVQIRQTGGVVLYGVLDAINQSDGDRWELRIKDPMSTALGADVQPAQSATVATAVTAGAVSIAVEESLGAYPLDTYFLVGEEVVKYTGVEGNGDLTVERGQFDTTAAAHAIGAELTSIYYWDNEPVEDIVRDLVVGRVVPNSLIDFEAIGTEFTGGFAKPESLKDILEELLTSGLAFMWWDSYRQRLRLASTAPWGVTIPELTDVEILDEGVSVRNNPKWQRTRSIVKYGGTSPVADRDDLETDTVTYIDSTLESIEGLNKQVEIEFSSRWIGNNDDHADLVARRLVERWSSTPLVLTARIPEELRDTYRLGDVVDVVAGRVAQQPDGKPRRLRMLITEADATPGVIQLRLVSWLPYSTTTVPTNIDIGADAEDVNVFALAGSPTVPVDLTVRVLADVDVTASQYTTPAMNIAGFHPDSTIRLNVASGANILGAGGYGGAGAAGVIVSVPTQLYRVEPAENGFDGGSAIRFTSGTLRIDNSGTIAGGGGGGSGGDATELFTQPDQEGNVDPAGWVSGGGGGGGAGVVGGTGGGGSEILLLDEDGVFRAPPHAAQDGATGTRTAAGAGGTGGRYQPNPAVASINGRNGSAGGLRGEDAPGAHGGLAGYVVELSDGATAYTTNAGSQFGRGQVTNAPPVVPSGDPEDWATNWSVLAGALADSENANASDNGGRFGSITGGLHLSFGAAWNNSGKYIDVTADAVLLSQVTVFGVVLEAAFASNTVIIGTQFNLTTENGTLIHLHAEDGETVVGIDSSSNVVLDNDDEEATGSEDITAQVWTGLALVFRTPAANRRIIEIYIDGELDSTLDTDDGDAVTFPSELAQSYIGGAAAISSDHTRDFDRWIRQITIMAPNADHRTSAAEIETIAQYISNPTHRTTTEIGL